MNSLLNLKTTKSSYLLLIILLCVSALGYSQENYFTKSKSSLVTLDNQTIVTSDIIKSEKTIVVFIKSYYEIHASYIEKLISAKEKGYFPNDTEIVAICYDNLGTFKHIKPSISKRNWDINVFIDKDRTLSNYVNLEQPLLTLIFEKNKLIRQFYGNTDEIDASFFGSRYGSVILD